MEFISLLKVHDCCLQGSLGTKKYDHDASELPTAVMTPKPIAMIDGNSRVQSTSKEGVNDNNFP
jgi:hypothetical protein